MPRARPEMHPYSSAWQMLRRKEAQASKPNRPSNRLIQAGQTAAQLSADTPRLPACELQESVAAFRITLRWQCVAPLLRPDRRVISGWRRPLLFAKQDCRSGASLIPSTLRIYVLPWAPLVRPAIPAFAK